MTRSPHFRVAILAALAACHRPPAVESHRSAAPAGLASSDAPPAAVSSSASPPSRAELDGVVAFVQGSLRDGVIGRRPEMFLRMFTDDARVVEGRREQPDPYDRISDVALLRVVAVAQARGTRTFPFEYGFRDASSTATNDEVRLRWTLVEDITGPHGKSSDESIETYRLRRTPQGWRVFQLRSWPTSDTFDGHTTIYDASFWTARETELTVARTSGDPQRVLEALEGARHVREAFEAAKSLSAADRNNTDAWRFRASLANELGLVDDVVASYQELVALDPKARIPGWVQAHPAWRPPP